MPKKEVKTRPRVYARVRPMFGRDADSKALFTIGSNTLEYTKEGSARRARAQCPAGAPAPPTPCRSALPPCRRRELG